MKILITGVCGFVGSTLAEAFLQAHPDWTILGVDNLSRPGSEINRSRIQKLGVVFRHGDLRQASDLEAFKEVDWVIDAAANPSVLAGVDGTTSSRQLVEHNLLGTINLLEFCRTRKAGFILLSTSRVYSIPPLAALPLKESQGAFCLDDSATLPIGVSPAGVCEGFSTAAPVSLYGATKLASESLALEYFHSFNVPVWINRCGVLAGAGQFGHPAQGIFAYWIHAHKYRRPLRYIGFGGSGYQVRDVLHPLDLTGLLEMQMAESADSVRPRLLNISGGASNSLSLRQLTAWCDARFGAHAVSADLQPRPLDIPWMVLDAGRAQKVWNWQPQRSTESILNGLALHAEANPGWLDLARA